MKPETVSAVHDGLWLAVNGRGTAGRARIAGRDVSGKTGTAQVISNQGKERARGSETGSSGSRLVRLLRAERQPRDCRCRVRRACRARLRRRDDRAAHHRDVLCSEGRPAAADPRGAARRTARARAAPGWRTAGPSCRGSMKRSMFERRLYYHIDWLLIGAVFAICAIGLAMIYSATGGPSRVYWTQIYALALGLLAMGICLTFDYRTLADKSHWFYIVDCRPAHRRAGLRRGARGIAPVDRHRHRQPAAFGVRQGGARADAGEALRREPPPFDRAPRLRHRRDVHGGAARAHRATTGSGNGGHAAADSDRHGVPGRLSDEGAGHAGAGRRAGGAGRVQVRAGGLSARTDLDVPRSGAGSARRRLSADSGQDHRRIGRDVGQGLHGRDAGAAAIPARGPQRLHLLGPGRGAGILWRAGGARPLPVRDRPVARRGARGQGSSGILPGARRAGLVHVSSDLQHHHVRGSGAGQGTDAPAHELRRVVDDRDARRVRTHPQRREWRRDVTNPPPTAHLPTI